MTLSEDISTNLAHTYMMQNRLVDAEKLYETLCSKEEMSKAEDLGKFYRVPADFRDLNYTKYLQEEGPKLLNEEYNSHNTNRLTKEELKKLLLTLQYVQEELKNYNN